MLSKLHATRIKAGDNLAVTARVSAAMSLLTILDQPEASPGHHDNCKRLLRGIMRELEPVLAAM